MRCMRGSGRRFLEGDEIMNQLSIGGRNLRTTTAQNKILQRLRSVLYRVWENDNKGHDRIQCLFISLKWANYRALQGKVAVKNNNRFWDARRKHAMPMGGILKEQKLKGVA